MTSLQETINQALFATLTRVKRAQEKNELGDERIKFTALLCSWISRIYDEEKFKMIFPNKGEMFNKLRVIDMIEDDLTLMNDKDILEQLGIKISKKKKNKTKKTPK